MRIFTSISLGLLVGALAFGSTQCEHGGSAPETMNVVDAGCGGSCAQSTDTRGPPYLWTCSSTAILDAGTVPGINAYTPFEGNAVCDGGSTFEFCGASAFIPCADDAGYAWSCAVTCMCRGQWNCDSCRWRREPCVSPAPYACPSEPVTYTSGAVAMSALPAGACNYGEHCLMRTRQLCDDTTFGTTSAFDCTCIGYDAPRSWQCTWQWNSLASCNRTDAGAADAGTSASGSYWLEIQGDGAPVRLTYEAILIPSDGCTNPTFEGWFDAATAPGLVVEATNAGKGTYYDRNGDLWKLSVTSLQVDDPPRNSPVAGTIEVDATGPGDASMHLLVTAYAEFRSPNRICD